MNGNGRECGLDGTVPTRCGCEANGLPHHNTEMRRGELGNLDDLNRSRRYSYADMLEKPRSFDVLYRLWVIGTNRVFLWGDPDYARRFSESASFGDSTGFEVLPPLSMKGGHYEIQNSWPLFEDPDLRHYEYEDERYWAWYLLFGRLGYSTGTDSAVWEREFGARFGDAASDVLEAYRATSKVLPLITAAHLTKHPNNWNWAELDTGGALFVENNHNPRFTDVTYATAEPSDPAMFYAIDEFVTDVIAGERAGKYTPVQLAHWYDHLASEARSAIEEAEAAAAETTTEFRATALDVRMLADLATYHADKTRAATALALYEETGDVTDLRDAHAYMQGAVDSWAALADRGDGTYHDDLLFAMGPRSAHEGTWADRLEYSEKLDTFSTDLSRGQQQKVMIAATFLHEPEVMFIDEPLVNLDPIVQERVKGYLERYVEAGNAVFLSTHHIEVAEQLCTRVGIVRAGRRSPSASPRRWAPRNRCSTSF
jgi:hypothetical protein